MLSGKIDTEKHRHDLGNHKERTQKDIENVTQIMWPSSYIDDAEKGPLRQRLDAVAKVVLGADAEFDFDFIIAKAAHTNTETPWHQDEAYWLDNLEDKRAFSAWCAMDKAVVENGCMWFIPKSHKNPVKSHHRVKGKHILEVNTEIDEKTEQAIAVPLEAGSCTLHHGRCLHHTKGNTSDSNSRAWVTNFRPRAMIEKERQYGFDHGLEKGVHGIIRKDLNTNIVKK